MVKTKWYRVKYESGHVLLVDANKHDRWGLFDLIITYGKIIDFKEISLDWGIDYEEGVI